MVIIRPIKIINKPKPELGSTPKSLNRIPLIEIDISIINLLHYLLFISRLETNQSILNKKYLLCSYRLLGYDYLRSYEIPLIRSSEAKLFGLYL